MIICRKRTTTHGAFLEFFVKLGPSGLYCPREIGRFKDRTVAAYDVVAHRAILTDSKAAGITKKSRADLDKNGTWIAYGDCMLRGGYPGVESKSVYYGIPIETETREALSQNIFELYSGASKTWPDCIVQNEPYVVYHGTSRDSVKSIFDIGLMPTQGMLGKAIYFGTFWKAWRFSCMTQDYAARPGAILRCYAFWRQPVIKTSESDKCLCPECGGRKEPPVDHLALWSKLGDCVIAGPTPTLKNEEYACLNNESIVIDSVGHSTKSSVHHEPLDRTFVID
jgi:hypothetical protein